MSGEVCVNCAERIKAFDGLLASGSSEGWINSHSGTCEGRGQIDYEAMAEAFYQVICDAQRAAKSIIKGEPAGTPAAGKHPEFDAAITDVTMLLSEADKIAWGDGQPKIPTQETTTNHPEHPVSEGGAE